MDVNVKLLAACEAWKEYFAELDRVSDDDDPMAAARRHLHRERIELTNEAIAAAQAQAEDDAKPVSASESVNDLVRELDVWINGDGREKDSTLSELVAQIKEDAEALQRINGQLITLDLGVRFTEHEPINTKLLAACEKLNEQNNDETWIRFFDAVTSAQAQAEDDAKPAELEWIENVCTTIMPRDPVIIGSVRFNFSLIVEFFRDGRLLVNGGSIAGGWMKTRGDVRRLLDALGGPE